MKQILWFLLIGNTALAADPAIERGKALYFKEGLSRDGEKQSCVTCHTRDPRQSGKTRAGKVIQPLSPSVNPERFTDPAKTEKWFKRNCGDVLGRDCTAQEKTDFIAFVRSL